MFRKKIRFRKYLNILTPNILISAIRVLSKNQKRKIYIVVMIQASLSVLDLAGVAAVGLVGALAVTGVQSKTPGNRVGQVLDSLNLQDTTLQKQVAILGLLAAILFIARTALSIVLSRKILFFLSRSGAALSGELVEKLLSQPLSAIREKSNQQENSCCSKG